jgi:hypothetical protein
LDAVKRLADLNVEDLVASPVWRYEGGDGSEAAVVPSKRKSLSQTDDEIFLAATEFELFDSSRHFGFCFPADDSSIDYLQPVILTPSGHVSFWFDGPAAGDVLSSQWKALGKEPPEIFPVSFRSLVPVDGHTVSGRIDGVVSSQDLASGLPAPTISEASGPTQGTDTKTESPGGADRILTARPVQARRDTAAIEKRTTRRRKAEMKVEFAQGAFHGTGITGNVSPRGMFVHSTQIPGTGPTLRLKVTLPEGRTLVLTARVVRSVSAISSSATSPGFGLRLTEDSPEYENLFSRLRNKPK